MNVIQHLVMISLSALMISPALAHEFDDSAFSDEHEIDDLEELSQFNFERELTCKKASKAQITQINKGNTLETEFYDQCIEETESEKWCQQVMRPNPDSKSIFQCTYGENQKHQLINPDKKTWKYAFQAIELVQDLEELGIKPCLIYNWWRPAPYNANVGGAAGRHPYGTAVDVRFCSMDDMEKAFTQLCKWRAKGRLRALGYYGSTGLHFGIGDKTANTWGKSCP